MGVTCLGVQLVFCQEVNTSVTGKNRANQGLSDVRSGGV
jgi:hypothetical protein